MPDFVKSLVGQPYIALRVGQGPAKGGGEEDGIPMTGEGGKEGIAKVPEWLMPIGSGVIAVILGVLLFLIALIYKN